MKTILTVGALAIAAAPAFAQTTYVQPDPYADGRYIATTPGSGLPPTYITPNQYQGGYDVTTPGSGLPATRVTPYGDGYSVNRPQVMPAPRSGGGVFDRFD